ncbi:MAG: tetratricopeptide repeat protein [Marinoscillum sp.]
MKTLSVLFLLCCSTAWSQTLKETADENYHNEKWQDAAKGYLKHVEKNEKDSSAWYRLAYCQYKLGEYNLSLKNFDKALATNFFPGYTLYNKAKVYTRMENEDQAYAALNEAVSKGFSNFTMLKDDDEWSNYQSSEQFAAIIQRTRENAFPCLTSEVQRHFDFWIGKWDVMVNGNKVGVNNITLAEGGCALHESYTTQGAYSGQSINYFDPMDKKWHQIWVDSNGGVLDYTEVSKNEGMIQFVADYLSRSGEVTKSRLTFTANEDGSVRQLFEDSTDGGESWTASFDGHYVKAED